MYVRVLYFCIPCSSLGTEYHAGTDRVRQPHKPSAGMCTLFVLSKELHSDIDSQTTTI